MQASNSIHIILNILFEWRSENSIETDWELNWWYEKWKNRYESDFLLSTCAKYTYPSSLLLILLLMLNADIGKQFGIWSRKCSISRRRTKRCCIPKTYLYTQSSRGFDSLFDSRMDIKNLWHKTFSWASLLSLNLCCMENDVRISCWTRWKDFLGTHKLTLTSLLAAFLDDRPQAAKHIVLNKRRFCNGKCSTFYTTRHDR